MHRYFRAIASRVRRTFSPFLNQHDRTDLLNNTMAAAGTGQLHLLGYYRQLLQRGGPFPSLRETEFRCYSQNGEDGILLFIFSQIGFSDRRVVEVCAADGIECNAANLLIHHGFQGLLFDGSKQKVDRGRSYYRHNRNTFTHPPTLVQCWITADSVNHAIEENGFSGQIDLLSLDIDGNDYWVLKSLSVIRPRVIVLEFNYELGPTASYSIAYDSAFMVDFADPPLICSASLAAFTKLLKARNYRLVGVQSLGFNAFFVHNDFVTGSLPERSPEECFADTPVLHNWTQDRLERMLSRSRSWQEV
jgi:hypothetical protein